jgi:hypothetical protein
MTTILAVVPVSSAPSDQGLRSAPDIAPILLRCDYMAAPKRDPKSRHTVRIEANQLVFDWGKPWITS